MVPSDLFHCHSGKEVSLENPTPSDIDIKDIAHALARIARFGGQTRFFYSVAEHSLEVMRLVPESHKLEALLHDSAEAYLGDIPKPLKNLLPEYQVIESRFMKVISRKFGFAYPKSEVVAKADHLILENEWHQQVIDGMPPQLSTEKATAEFLSAFKRYFK